MVHKSDRDSKDLQDFKSNLSLESKQIEFEDSKNSSDGESELELKRLAKQLAKQLGGDKGTQGLEKEDFKNHIKNTQDSKITKSASLKSTGFLTAQNSLVDSSANSPADSPLDSSVDLAKNSHDTTLSSPLLDSKDSQKKELPKYDLPKYDLLEYDLLEEIIVKKPKINLFKLKKSTPKSQHRVQEESQEHPQEKPLFKPQNLESKMQTLESKVQKDSQPPTKKRPIKPAKPLKTAQKYKINWSYMLYSKRLFIGVCAIACLIGLYSGYLLFGSLSVKTLVSLHERRDAIAKQVEDAKMQNALLQKKVLELLSLEPDRL